MLNKVVVGLAAVLFLALLAVLVVKTPLPERAAPAMPAPEPRYTPLPVGPHVTQAYQHCIETARAEVDRGYCLGDELDRQNAALKAAFDKRAGELSEYREDMIKAQKAWEVYRDADCAAKQVRSGTSSAATSWLTCMVRLTADRAAEMPGYGRW